MKRTGGVVGAWGTAGVGLTLPELGPSFELSSLRGEGSMGSAR